MSCLNNYNLDVILNQLNCWCLQWRGKIATVFPSGMTQIEQIQELFTAVKNCCEAQVEVMEKFCELYKFVTDYLTNLNIQKYVNEWLDGKLKDGTLEDLLNATVLEDILKETGEIIHNYPFEWRGDLYKNFLDMVYSVAASYFVNCVNCLCVNGTPTGRNTPFFAKYNDGNTYVGLLGQGEFISTDKEIYNEVEYPVLYCDCSGFVSLLTKGRDYVNSPYYKAFNGETNQQTLIKSALEIGTYWDNEYTIDFLNKIVTYWMADILNNSGCPLHKLSTYDPSTKKLNVDESEFKFLKNGDILFSANAELTNRYRGIHHCMIYLKSLDDFNVYGEPYGVTFKALIGEDDNESYGYIIHCDGDNGILKIETLYKRMTQAARETGVEYTYYSHAVHTVFNSSMANYKLNGMFNTYNNTFLIGRSGNSYGNSPNKNTQAYYSPDDFSFNAYILRAPSITAGRGFALKNGDDLNDKSLEGGIYFSDSASISAGIQNSPWSEYPFQLYYMSRYLDGENSRYGVMLAFTVTGSNPARMKVRTCGYNGVWSNWYNVTLTE